LSLRLDPKTKFTLEFATIIETGFRRNRLILREAPSFGGPGATKLQIARYTKVQLCQPPDRIADPSG
jgi:hypothetical protein